MHTNDDINIEIRDIKLIDIKNLLIISQIGVSTIPATKVEKTNKVLILLPDSSTLFNKNLSI